MLPRNTYKLAWLVLLFACDSSTGPRGDLQLEGTVTSAATGTPISGASVEVGDGSGFVLSVVQSTTTDAQGYYTLRIGCINTPYLRAYAAGYDLDEEPLACRDGTQTVNMSLTPSRF